MYVFRSSLVERGGSVGTGGRRAMCLQVLGEKKYFICAFKERGGSVGNGGRRAMNICAYLEKKKRKEKKRISRILFSRRLYFTL